MTIPPTAEINITTTSERIPQWTGSGTPPTITMNGAPFAQLPQPRFPSGWQVVVINAAGDLTSPENVLSNTYIELQQESGSWGTTYHLMYSQMLNAILTAGNIEQQLLLIATFGLDLYAPPTNDTLGFLLTRGAGAGLQKWDSTPDAGSQGAGWIANPVSYILIGGSAYGYADAWETFVYNNGDPANASLSVTLGNNVPPTPPTPQTVAAD